MIATYYYVAYHDHGRDMSYGPYIEKRYAKEYADALKADGFTDVHLRESDEDLTIETEYIKLKRSIVKKVKA